MSLTPLPKWALGLFMYSFKIDNFYVPVFMLCCIVIVFWGTSKWLSGEVTYQLSKQIKIFYFLWFDFQVLQCCFYCCIPFEIHFQFLLSFVSVLLCRKLPWNSILTSMLTPLWWMDLCMGTFLKKRKDFRDKLFFPNCSARMLRTSPL